MKSLIKKAWVFLQSLSVVACAQNASTFEEMTDSLYENTVPLMQSKELAARLERGEDVLILDTRALEEYQVSHLPNAQLMGYKKPKMELMKGVDKAQTIVLYCSVGYRSERIGEQLQEKGFRSVYNLYGGLFDWVNQGEAVYNAKGKTDKVHAYSKSWGKWIKQGEKVYE